MPHLCALSRYRPGSVYEVGKEPWRGIHESVQFFPFQKTPLPHHRLGMTDCLPKASPWAQGRGSARHGHLL